MLLQLGRPMCVGQLARLVGVTSATATYHVAKMHQAGLVALERRGRNTFVRRVNVCWGPILRAFATAE
jgi:DNA-binding transcriptional ArsR family regulator